MASPTKPIMCDDGPVIVGMPRMSGRALQALLPDIRGLPGPVYSALCDAIVSLVLDGRVAAETRLPSERELALQLRLSRATVTAAYDRLRAQGFLQSRTGRRQLRNPARWDATDAVSRAVVSASNPHGRDRPVLRCSSGAAWTFPRRADRCRRPNRRARARQRL